MYSFIGFGLVLFGASALGHRGANNEHDYGRRPPSHGPGWGPAPAPSTNGHGWDRPTTAKPAPLKGDTRTLDQLHRLALAEGGKLILYAGGDSSGSQDATKQAFEKRFPGMSMEVIVDFSKFQDARIDYQLETNTLVPDVTQLQTLQDFPKWAAEGVFLNYRPIGWDQVYDELKSDGYYYAITIYVFSNFINNKLLPDPASWPREARDYLRPEFKNRIVATYPHDDDGVLYWLEQVVDKYGWQYVRDLRAQNVTWVRGTRTANDIVTAGQFPVTFTTGGSLTPRGGPTSFVLPKDDPFVFWGQLGGIFKGAKHPNAAKLYMSWCLDAERQANGNSWPVRRDFPQPAGYKNPFDYTQTTIMGMSKFIADRQAVETFKTQVALILGEVQGPTPTGTLQLGTNPTVALPH